MKPLCERHQGLAVWTAVANCCFHCVFSGHGFRWHLQNIPTRRRKGEIFRERIATRERSAARMAGHSHTAPNLLIAISRNGMLAGFENSQSPHPTGSLVRRVCCGNMDAATQRRQQVTAHASPSPSYQAVLRNLPRLPPVGSLTRLILEAAFRAHLFNAFGGFEWRLRAAVAVGADGPSKQRRTAWR